MNRERPIPADLFRSLGVSFDTGPFDFRQSKAQQECRVSWKPFPDSPQQEAYESPADEMWYGGEAGGGKTDLALGLATTRHSKSLILRRDFPQMAEIVDRSIQIVGDNGNYNQSTHKWRLNHGASIEFGSCLHEPDKRKYQGRPHDLIVLDEAPEFLESQFVFIAGWARTDNPKQRVRVVLTGNPPQSAEGYWILKRYAAWVDPKHPNPAKSGEIRFFAMIDGVDTEVDGPQPFEHHNEARGKTEIITPKSRTFIRASVDDNPVYAKSGYKAQLQALPEPLRSQMLYGDMTVGHDDDSRQVIPTAWVRAAQERWKPRHHDGLYAEAIAVDVARGGKCKTAIARRESVWFDEVLKYPGTSTPDGPAVAQLVIPHIKVGLTGVSVDITGVGSSVFDQLVQADLCPVTGVVNAQASEATDRSGKLKMVNLRAAQYWALREALDPQLGDNLELPPDPEVLADLTAPRWKLSARGIQIESKEELSGPNRLGRSPDCGDAIVMAYSELGGAFGRIITGGKREAYDL